jgi:hypothetical protein
MVEGLCAIQILQRPFARRGLINQLIRCYTATSTMSLNGIGSELNSNCQLMVNCLAMAEEMYVTL